ncbi:MAG: hypothetical protein ACREX3_04720, partial [Gammaproteobacteria bacterium]
TPKTINIPQKSLPRVKRSVEGDFDSIIDLREFIRLYLARIPLTERVRADHCQDNESLVTPQAG